MKKAILLWSVVALLLLLMIGCGDSSKVPVTETTLSTISNTAVSTTTSKLTTERTTSTTKATTTTTKVTTTTTTQPSHIHKFSVATCTSPEICSCGATRGGALGHQYSPATCTTPKICARCGVIAAAALGHQFDPATCTSPKICFVCGEVSGSPLGHDYKEATCTSPEICVRCAHAANDALGHNYVKEKCTRCGKWDRIYLLEDIDAYSESSAIVKTLETVQDNNGNTYTDHYKIYSEANVNGGHIRFVTDKLYSTFCGTIFLPYHDRGEAWAAKIQITADDGRVLYESQELKQGCKTENFSIDISGVSSVTIRFDDATSMHGSTRGYLTNAYFKK